MAAAGAWFLQVMQDEEEEIKEKQKFRNSYARSNYKMCYWYLMLQNPYIADPTTREGKQFRRRFECKGAYLITDGGYHLWRCCQPPIKAAWNEDECHWSLRLESVRKNVECTFGILKVRFRILKFPMMYNDRAKVPYFPRVLYVTEHVAGIRRP